MMRLVGVEPDGGLGETGWRCVKAVTLHPDYNITLSAKPDLCSLKSSARIHLRISSRTRRRDRDAQKPSPHLH
jgi:hypothetical protein